VATETMADVYLSQGHRQKALEIYEKLLQERPQDPRLLSKVKELAVAVFLEQQKESAGDGSGPDDENPNKPLAGRKIKKEFKKKHQSKTNFKRKKNGHDDEQTD
jgi:hypothetical protein